MSMHNPSHPGEILKALLIDPLGLTVTEVSEKLGISRKTLSKVVNCRCGITPEMAVRLEIAFSKPSADHWLRLQNAYDLWHARKHKTTFKVQPFRIKAA